MATTEQLSEHYLTQAKACDQAMKDIKKNPANRFRESNVRNMCRPYSLAMRAWNDAARALASGRPGAEEERERRVGDALEFHALANARRAELEGGEVAPTPQAEPDSAPVEDVAVADITRTETHAYNDPDNGAPMYAYSTGTTPDGRHVTITEDTLDDHGSSLDSNGNPYTEMRHPRIFLHPSADSAREEMLADVVEAGTDRTVYASSHGAVILGWGDRYRVGATPHDGQTWRLAVRDGYRLAVTYHPGRLEAVDAALLEADRIAERLSALGANGSRVDELGGLWLAHKTADARSAEIRCRFVERYDQAKQDRVVDRYGQISNEHFAQLVGISVQALSKMR